MSYVMSPLQVQSGGAGGGGDPSGAELTLTNATSGHGFALRTNTVDVNTSSGATQDTSGLIPAGALILGIDAEITTTVTGPASVSVGGINNGDPDRFGSFTSLAAGQKIADGAVQTTPPFFADLETNVRLTANGGNFTGGVIRVTALYLIVVA